MKRFVVLGFMIGVGGLRAEEVRVQVQNHQQENQQQEKPEGVTQAVLAQFLNIVANSLAFVAGHNDKDTQMHALSNMITSVANIVDLANRSPQNLAIILALLEQCKEYDIEMLIKRCLDPGQ